MAEHTFAKVLIDRRGGVGEEMILTYRVPRDVGQLSPGTPVLVPLGRTQATGYVLELIAAADQPLPRIRSVLGPLAEAPAVPAELVELARWMSHEYCCSLASAMRCMIPEGAHGRVERQYQASPDEQLQAALFAEPDDIVGVLRRAERPLAAREIARAIGRRPSREELDGLVRQGRVKVSWAIGQPRTRRKTAIALELNVTRQEALEAAEQLERRAPAQAALLKRLAESDQPLSLRQVEQSQASVRGLCRRGLVRRTQRDLFRVPAMDTGWQREAHGITLSPEQETALQVIRDALAAGRMCRILLHGVTGSGKTEVYLRAIHSVLEQSGGSIVLVPEISLTPQVAALFRRRFGERVAVLHSALSSGERLDEWRRIQAGEARVAVGARSAIFAPVRDLRLIVVDEEQESSYKQDHSPRYHARRVAEWRAQRAGAVLVLGSATPAIETYFEAQQGHMALVQMPYRVGGGELPEVEIVDLRQEKGDRKRSLISERLTAELKACVERGDQAILLLNRRGFSPYVFCYQCGQAFRCPNCAVSLTYHSADRTLQCHHCEHRQPAPDTCSNCRSIQLSFSGVGTERIHEELAAHVPQARLLRMDRDTVSTKGAHEQILRAFAQHEADVLMGTQMIAKGLDYESVTLVGVISADTGLNFSDFRATENTFTLLTQVSGRAGRGSRPGRVIIQTFQPDHFAVRSAVAQDYRAFYDREIEFRRKQGYPPFTRLANIVAAHEDPAAATAAAEEFGRAARDQVAGREGYNVLGPSPAPLQRLRGRTRWHVEVFGPHEHLPRVVEAALDQVSPETRRLLTVDIDPSSVL